MERQHLGRMKMDCTIGKNQVEFVEGELVIVTRKDANPETGIVKCLIVAISDGRKAIMKQGDFLKAVHILRHPGSQKLLTFASEIDENGEIKEDAPKFPKELNLNLYYFYKINLTTGRPMRYDDATAGELMRVKFTQENDNAQVMATFESLVVDGKPKTIPWTTFLNITDSGLLEKGHRRWAMQRG